MRIADDTISVLIEGNENQLDLMARALRTMATSTSPIIDFSLQSQAQKELFISVAADITRSIAEKRAVQNFLIFARGKRSLALGFKRAPDVFIGREYASNFLEACFKRLWCEPGYNSRNNTYRNHQLFFEL